jgi:hypothetical protein
MARSRLGALVGQRRVELSQARASMLVLSRRVDRRRDANARVLPVTAASPARRDRPTQLLASELVALLLQTLSET